MAHKVAVFLFLSMLFQELLMVNSTTYDKKTLDGMILKTLWTKVYTGYDPKIKEQAINTLRKTGDYDKLINHLLKVKKEKVQRILNLLAEIIIAYERVDRVSRIYIREAMCGCDVVGNLVSIWDEMFLSSMRACLEFECFDF